MFRLGYQIAIYPATGFLAMGQALNKVYRNLSETGDLEVQCTDHGIFGHDPMGTSSVLVDLLQVIDFMKFLLGISVGNVVSRTFLLQVFWRAMVGVDI